MYSLNLGVRKMRKNKITILMMAIILTILMTISFIPLPPANAQTSGEFATYAYISVAPNPVGVGQST